MLEMTSINSLRQSCKSRVYVRYWMYSRG